MGEYRELDKGETVEYNDPRRGIWYSACGCGYWTDDWSKLSYAGKTSIPCCPSCGAVGMQTNAKNWFSGAVEFENSGNQQYVKFLENHKECCQIDELSFFERYRLYVKNNGKPNGLS
jgi:hypothetical protein